MQAKILEVDSVSMAMTKSMPPGLLVHAIGKVSTSGWTNATLIPHIYVQEPPDGIWDFDMVAEPPKGMALQIVSPIGASLHMEVAPSWVKAVRVHASRNSMTNEDVGALAAPGLFPADGGVDTFPWVVGQ
ncbi:hypothetical protein [uncultured Pseudacidovorax sp.]|uniref:hypothetical protein n=1 Tax=uncultured Pseudacidovorax sp. TaxID=679313 RepID=UPI00260116C0|nr:hypothetical protein [uncultured Pseudacidovorax sp.]